MPQVICPNCGVAINLENRRETDFNLIINAAKKKPVTFTELLHTTRLPRKTLSLRLKELCVRGEIIKSDGVYRLNGAREFGGYKKSIKTLSTVLHDARVRKGLMLLSLLIFSSAYGYVLATFLKVQLLPTHQEPTMLGSFTMFLQVDNVEDLYAWQVAIYFKADQLCVLKVEPGDFFAEDFPFFVNSTDSSKNLLLIGACLHGDMCGKSGGGTLARIVFGYFTENFEEPRITYDGVFETFLESSKGKPINGANLTLTRR